VYLNFAGYDITGSAWNSSLGRTNIPALAFSTDTDYSTYSDTEQGAIKRIWQRVAEDYAPFNVDVTTERPAVFGTRTAHALITRNTDADGQPNPSSSAGGVAYVNVFGTSSMASSRPAWIYHNNLGNGEANTAEAASHEVGHNLGLSHDGTTSAPYYNGHGTGYTSWGPLMGTGYGRNVSQWSKGEYYLANNTQDDLATIAGKVSYRPDDRGDTAATATALVLTGTNVVSTTPEGDPANNYRDNKGVLERNNDVDVFSFTTGSGTVELNVTPWITATGTRGGNLDVLVELYDSTARLVMTNNSGTETKAQIQASLAAGTYYLYVRNSGAGDPLSSTPTGYTPYGSIGQYFISGYVAPSTGAVQLNASANNGGWGSVAPSSGSYPAGSTVQVVATPYAYFRFANWTNGASGASNALSLVLNTNTSVQAVFAEIMTTNRPTPYWWLASFGYTNFETAVNLTGANGMPLWQSYVAGLNPNDPNSRLRATVTRASNGRPVVSWNTVSGRVYTLWSATNAAAQFTRVVGASDLPATVQRFTNWANPLPPTTVYRLEVRKP
jgi:hypothetical protein